MANYNKKLSVSKDFNSIHSLFSKAEISDTEGPKNPTFGKISNENLQSKKSTSLKKKRKLNNNNSIYTLLLQAQKQQN